MDLKQGPGPLSQTSGEMGPARSRLQKAQAQHLRGVERPTANAPEEVLGIGNGAHMGGGRELRHKSQVCMRNGICLK